MSPEAVQEIVKLEAECDLLMEELQDYNVSPSKAQELSNKFLGMSYRINRKIRDMRNEMIKLSLLERNSYSKAFKSQDPKLNVSKAKAFASADKEYMRSHIMLQRNENERDYWKGIYDIFNDAHKFYKSLCRE